MTDITCGCKRAEYRENGLRVARYALCEKHRKSRKRSHRTVTGAQGEPYNVTITDDAILIREPRKTAYLVPWGRVFLLGAQIEADKQRAEAGREKRITRGLLTVR